MSVYCCEMKKGIIEVQTDIKSGRKQIMVL